MLFFAGVYFFNSIKMTTKPKIGHNLIPVVLYVALFLETFFLLLKNLFVY